VTLNDLMRLYAGIAPLRRFRPVGELIRTAGEQALRILSIERLSHRCHRDGEASAPLPVKVAGGAFPLTMLANGITVG
jgi:penicillin-binding protein 1C